MNLEEIKDWRNYMACLSDNGHPQVTRRFVENTDWLISEVDRLRKEKAALEKELDRAVDTTY